MEEIVKATNNFSPNLLIGEGGSSWVYKGKLNDGTTVAVKRAKTNLEDEARTRESFQNEIKTLQQIHHINLVGFHGYLAYGGEQIIVVEYVPKGNLRQHLDCLYGKILEFSTRLDVIIDVAHAITYLHTYCDKPVIHRDIKSSNILLTDSFHAKVADFGLAKLASTDAEVTYVQTLVKGTPGYVDPEYFQTNQLTEKSDVYSFGVLLVELVTARRPVERIMKRIMADWALDQFYQGKAMEMLDPNLQLNSAINLAVEQIFELASQCLRSSRKNRLDMKNCAEILWNIRKVHNENSKSMY